MMVVEEKCMYPDVKDLNQACPYSASKVMLGYHIKKEHHPKKERGESELKKTKRMDPKPPPKFNENEMRDELRQKQAEFRAYANRMKISREDEADDLYLACDSPLKRKLRASSKVQSIIGKTKPDILMSELERISLPKISWLVERQQFWLLKQ